MQGQDSGIGDEQSDQSRETGDISRRAVLETTGMAALAGLASTATGSEHDVDDHHVADLVPTSNATHSATTSGSWSDPGIWDNGVPTDGARVHVPSGVTVTADANPSARLHWLRVDGTLSAATSQTAELLVDTIITTEGSTLQLGSASDPVGPSGELTITFIDRGPIDESWDDERKTRGLATKGAVDIHGAEKTSHTTLATHATAGDSSLELDAAPTNWEAGDALVLPGVSPHVNEDEEVTVASVSGSTVNLEETLQYDHVPPAGDLDSYVLNLDRYVRFRSENTDSSQLKRRGHIMIMQPGSTIRYAGLYDLGRTDKSIPFSNPAYKESEIRNDGVFNLAVNDNRRARYALHFHKTGPRYDLEPHDVTGCAIAPRTDGTGWKGSPGWGFVNHQSYAHIQDCVSYKVFGSHYQTETGVEIGSFVNNFALRSEGSGEDPDFREVVAWADHANRPLIDDYGHNGIGFWLHGPLVLMEDNVAAGQRNHGIAYWTRAIGDYVPPEVDDPAVPPSELDREIVEADIGRHRGTIPNVPAPYGDNRPSETFNVAPSSSGPNVAEFAHATYTADDGTVFVDEGSFPLRDVNSTAFACGSGMEVMNHMRGAGSQMDGQTDYYGLVKDYTAWNIGRRNDESELPDTQIYQSGDLSFEFPRGTGIGFAKRYASHIRLENPRLIGTGDGVGITHNMRVGGMVVENATIENWSSGIGALTDGLMEIRNPTFANITNYEINIQGEQILAGNPTTRMWNVDSGDQVYMNPTSDVGTDWERTYSLDGRQVYFESAAPGDAESDPRLVGGLIEPGSGTDGTAPSAPSNLSSPAHTESSIDLDWDASSDTGGSGLDHYEVYVGGALDHTVSAGGTTTTVSGLSGGTTYDLSVTAVDGAGNTSAASNTVTVTTDSASSSQSAYNGPHAIPGTLQVEDYDTGGEGVAYHDTTSGNTGGAYRSDDVDIESTGDSSGAYNVGWVASGEWLEYTVQVDSGGTYDLTARVASASGGGTFHVKVDGTNATGSVSFPATGGWQTWTTVDAGSVDLSAGEHVLQLYAETGSWNVNWLEFAGSGDGTAPTAPANLSSPAHGETTIDLAWDASSDSGGSGLDHYNVFVNGAQDHTVAAGTTTTTVSGLSSDTAYDLSVTAVDGAGNESGASNTVTVTTDAATSGQSAYNGPHSIPGTLQAQDYDTGGEGVAFHDTTSSNQGGAYRSDAVDIESTSDSQGGSYNVGYVVSGEWLEYTVQVDSAGDYDVSARVASASGGGSLTVDADGSSASTSFSATGGWQSWTTVDVGTLSLSAGETVVRVTADASDWNFNFLEFSDAGSSSGTVVSAINAGGSSYTAGDGTQFQADPAFSGGSTASTGDSISGTTDDALYQSERYGNFTYDVSVANGTYDVVLHFAETYFTSDGSRVFDVVVEGTEEVSNLDVHSQVGHDAATTVTVSGVSVSDGSLTLDFTADVDNAKISAIEVITA